MITDKCLSALKTALRPWTITGSTKGGSITVQLTFCLTGLDSPVLQIKTKIVSCHTADAKPVKQEVNSTVILPPYYVNKFVDREVLCIGSLNKLKLKSNLG